VRALAITPEQRVPGARGITTTDLVATGARRGGARTGFAEPVCRRPAINLACIRILTRWARMHSREPLHILIGLRPAPVSCLDAGWVWGGLPGGSGP
jgi:hypothetical protein